MKVNILIAMLLTSQVKVRAKESFIGTVVKIKGEVYRLYNPISKTNEVIHKNMISSNSKLYEKDIILTSEKSFVKIKLTDDTVISIGSGTRLSITKFNNNYKKRLMLFDLLHGKIRAHIIKKAKSGDLIQINSKTASIGVRGTSFFTSVYKVKSKMTTDVLLMTGKVETNVTGLLKPVTLMPKQGLSTLLSVSDGNYSSLTEISNESLVLLQKYSEDFLPDLVDKNGKRIDLDNEILKKYKYRVKENVKESKEKDNTKEEEEEYEEDDEGQAYEVDVEVNQESSENNE